MSGLDRRRLIAAFASVAVASAAGLAATAATGGAVLPALLLSGGILGGGEAVMQAIEAIKNQLDASEPTRALSKAIDVAVTVSVKDFPTDAAQQGVDLAARIVAVRGLSAIEIAMIDFDATRAANRVLAESARLDPGWAGGEPAYKAAEAAIRATYQVLAAQARSGEHALVPVLAGLRDDLVARLHNLAQSLEKIEATTGASEEALKDLLSHPAGGLDEVLKWHPPLAAADLDLTGSEGPRLGSWLTQGGLPGFAPRDIDNELDERIATASAGGGLVVVSGAPKSGKTRTVVEAMRRVVPGRMVWSLLPTAGTAVADGRQIDPVALVCWQVAVGQYKAGQLVVVLDDLQGFLHAGPNQLSESRLRSLTDLGLLVIATVHAEALTRIRNYQQGNASSDLRMSGSGIVLAGDDRSLMATITSAEVALPSAFTDTEMEGISADVDAAANSAHIPRDQLRRLPEVLAAVDKMKTLVAEAEHNPGNPERWTLLRAGFAASICYPVGATIKQLHQLYGWADTKPADRFNRALKWGTAPIGSPDSPHSLITKADLANTWRLFDAITSHLTTKFHSQLAWLDARIPELEPLAGLSVGMYHHRDGDLGMARTAFWTVIDSGDAVLSATAAAALGVLESDAGDLFAARVSVPA